MYSHFKITQTAPTVAALMGIDAPKGSAEVNPIVYDKAKSALPAGVDAYDRVLIYNPDAVALWLYQKYTDLFAPAIARTDIQMSLTSMVPSVTPVCFASIYTGLEPKDHGIQGLVKPVLAVETLFDTALRAGKKVAIIAVNGCSISRIFAERTLDYYILPTYQECLEKVLEIIPEDKYDLVVFYNGTYDGTMHKYAPESEQAIKVLEQNCKDFATVVDAVRTHWGQHNTFYGFCPDHGCHAVPEDKIDRTAKWVDLGSHGSTMDVDMNVIHMFGTNIAE